MRRDEQHLLSAIRLALWSISFLLVFMVMLAALLFVPLPTEHADKHESLVSLHPKEWYAPDSTRIPNTEEGDLIRYGRELIAHTAVYLGPQGSVAIRSNGMNCQNCHLKAGKKSWGNNYAAVASTYPKFRNRSGTIESIERRVNDCIQRSLNGIALEENSREMSAMVAYIKWVGGEVPQGVEPPGSGIADIPYLSRPADPKLGMAVYETHCTRCHGSTGEGVRNISGKEWLYPPLWGENSFNTGAGILRLSRMAGFVFHNMPNDPSARRLGAEEAWDVAAFICSQPRPVMDLSGDWPDISTKPSDHPFGPYADDFPEEQHKYGPFGPMIKETVRR